MFAQNKINKYMSEEMKQIQQIQLNLPVYKFKAEILRTVKENPITLIVGETGSGKTTQIPQYLLEWKEIDASHKIVCTQPRTVAAQSVAQRVSEEQGNQKWGTGIVGYHIRLDRQTIDGQTVLEYMTEGVLLRKAMSCDNLSQYKVVIIDEAHERTVNADLLMGFLKQMVRDRGKSGKNSLRVIIMSATLDLQRFKKYFDSPPIIRVPGSANAVSHHWLLTPTTDYKQLTIDAITAIHCNPNDSGQLNEHILVFMTGQKDIEDVCHKINDLKNSHKNNGLHNLEIYPLYSALSNEDRKRAFAEPKRDHRKCVVATNVAETSLTINNVVYVIDCGLSKQKVYSPSKGMEILGIRGISKASVMQRVGRAGRVKPGIAYHLYTQNGYRNYFPNETSPEILRSGLVNEILSMLALGIRNPLEFDFIDAPNEMTMARALHILKNLGAIDRECLITELGMKMARIPVNAKMAKSLIAASEMRCVYEMAVIASMLEIEDRLWKRKPTNETDRQEWKKRKKSFYHASGDHLTLLNVYNAWDCVKKNGSVQHFCDANWLKRKQLERADGIKKQIENVLADFKANNNNGNGNSNTVYFEVNHPNFGNYYSNIAKALLCGHFMNVAVKGFTDKYWRFRLLPLDVNQRHKCVDIIDKAKAHQNSVFDKNNCMNWVIYNEVQITHTAQLKIITAIKPVWLKEIDSNAYYDLQSLEKDNTPISRVLRNIH